jgi:flagellin
MGMRINTNIDAFDAQRNLSMIGVQYSASVQKLSSGLRINSAADDAAGLSISEKLKAQVSGLTQAQRNAQDGISMIQTGEGALNETHSMLQRMRELAVQASNGTLTSDDQNAINLELQQLDAQITRSGNQTQFNSMTLLNGSLKTAIGTSSAVSAGMALSSTSISVSSVDVSGAVAGHTFSISNSGASVTLKDTTTGDSQTLTVGADTTAGESLNFSALGIKINLAGSAGGSGASIAADLNSAGSITTAASNSVTAGAVNFQVGANANQSLTVAFGDMRSTAIGKTGAANGNYASLDAAVNDFSNQQANNNVQGWANNLISSIDQSITDVSNQRANFGAFQNTLQHTINNLGVAQENLSASESRIRDTDMAAEMVNFTKLGILQQAGQSILSQANQAPQQVLQLLR